MKRIKSFLMVLIIIELFVFASCKNNFTSEQVKVACNAKKTTIKGIAKIEDKFVPRGTIIELYEFKPGFIQPKKLEDITVSDDEGHFESTTQFDVVTIGVFNTITLKIDEDKPTTFKAQVYNWSVKEDIVYNFEGEAIIEGFAARDSSSFFPRVPNEGKGVYLLSKKNNSNCIESYNEIETMLIDSPNGHFKSQRKYNKRERSKYVMRMTDTVVGIGVFRDINWYAQVSPDLSDIPWYLFKQR